MRWLLGLLLAQAQDGKSAMLAAAYVENQCGMVSKLDGVSIMGTANGVGALGSLASVNKPSVVRQLNMVSRPSVVSWAQVMERLVVVHACVVSMEQKLGVMVPW